MPRRRGRHPGLELDDADGQLAIPLQSANVDAWLSAPAPADYQAILDERERPYYAHQLAAAA